ncbi:hypothetical protein L6164_000022 [Bauhinia variegata]|uniref:Uncharacterized protein n=1 Tax=Bauhinia variegata TaxID=167791 RepID=A0ACB9Q7F3_BAUVA|nr:hypothetical protein L6164_000022 [Bauhinia variegata]
MTKVYPNAAAAAAASGDDPKQKTSSLDEAAVIMTVWKKSLLLNCHGFTVFDGQGNLVFRVDNYLSRHNKDNVLLMDAAGTPLLTLRHKRLSLGEKWEVYEGESTVKAQFSARKHVSVLNSKCLAHVTMVKSSENENEKGYEIEGSYAQRCCSVMDKNKRLVAEIKKKEAAAGGVAFGADVFRLIVEPEMDTALAMAFVILLDLMFGSSSR